MSAITRTRALLRRTWIKWTGGAALLGLAIYASAVVAGVTYLRRDGISQVQWHDLALPTRWPRVQMARGDHQLSFAYTFARRGQYREAIAYARAGLAKSPANRSGRLLLARLLVARAPSSAEEILLGGLQYHDTDPACLGALFSHWLRRQEDDKVIRLAREHLARPELPTSAARIAGHAAATASFLRGNYDDAEDFLRSVTGLAESREGRLLSTRIDWERGYRALALVNLRALARNLPSDPEVYSELVRRLRTLGEASEARRVTLAFQIAQPDLAAPRVELLHAYHDAGDHHAFAREIDVLLNDLDPDPKALALLGDFAADTGNIALARRIVGVARDHNLPLEPHAFLLVETLIVARDYKGAFAAIDQFVAENADWARHYRALLDSLRAVAALGAGDLEAARLYLRNFLQQPGLRAENLLALADRFAALDASAQVRDILARAVAADPLNQAALTRLIEVDLNANRIDDLPLLLERLLAMRKPSPDLLRVAQHKLGSDLFLFSAARAPALDAIATVLDRPRRPAAPPLIARSPEAP